MGNAASSHDDRLIELARRLLDGEAIDWDKEGIAESEVREGMKRLERIIGRPGETTQTRQGSDSEPSGPSPPTPAPRPGEDRVIGGFRLVRKLGEGGMGVVYEAEQKHPRRRVALKVIRGGSLVSPDTLKLFRREIQTLARLSHSGIAQLYEAGVTDDGMHFFAMELVRGEPLSDWLRSRPKGPMTPAELKIRLGVFRKICDAVAYAHQKGVIHRDLKPGNILIPKPPEGSSIQDAIPDVKVLDFGLARITDSDVQATTFVTEMGKVQGTLPYMSPEQVRGNPDEIDLRTDVYTLGVILYEMVAGRLPYDISKAQIPEAVRIICEDPPRSLTATFVGTRRLDADVITIAAKCLEKESARRYQSAAALGEEVQRYLTHQPILARPPSAAYQLRKLVARHKLPFAFAGAVFVLLALLAAVMTVQAARIARQRDRANQAAKRATEEAAAAKAVSDFLEEMFTSADPSAGATITAKEILDRGTARVRETLTDQPVIRARLMSTMGTVYTRLGIRQEAELLLKQAVEVNRRQFGVSSPEYARSLNTLGWSLTTDTGFFSAPGREADARSLHQQALEILEKAHGPDHVDVGWSCYFLGRLDENGQGRRLFERALKIFEKDPEQNWKGIAWCLQALCNTAGHEGGRRQALGDTAGGDRLISEAILYVERALTIVERHTPANSYELTPYLGNLGFWLCQAGRFREAIPLFRRSLKISENVGLPPDSPVLGFALDNLGWALTGSGEYDEARKQLRRALAIFERIQHNPRGRSSQLAVIPEDLLELELATGRYTEAEALYRRVIDLREHAFPDDLALANSLEHYASFLKRLGRPSEAAKLEARAKGIRTKVSKVSAE